VPNDTIISATVLANKAILVTHNTKEFGRGHNLMIEDWIVGK
jgi:predicted nucleic acid-binding protein